MEIKTRRNYLNKKTKKIYLVTGFAKHSETEEDLVLYKEVGGASSDTWARPITSFQEKFEDTVSDRIL